MEGRHQGDVSPLLPVASGPGDGYGFPEEGFGGKLPERHDDPGLDDANLCRQKPGAGIDFGWLWDSVLRRPALDHVGDIRLRGADVF